MSVAGNNNPSGDVTIQIKITDDTSSPNQFQWNSDGGAFSADTPLSTSATTLVNSIAVTFASVEGHTLNAVWEIQAGDATATITDSPSRT